MTPNRVPQWFLALLLIALAARAGFAADNAPTNTPSDTPQIRFIAYDAPPGGKLEEMSFQINSVERGRKTEFLKVGEKVTKTDLQIVDFSYKTRLNPTTGADEDVSELTLINTKTNVKTVIVLNQAVNSP